MLKTKITEMFGIKHPIASAAMGPFKTNDLCIAVSEAGGLGMISHTNVSPTGIESNYVDAMIKNLDYVVEHTDGIFGFNVRTSRVEPGIDKLISEISRHISENAKLKEQCLYALTSAGSSRRMPENKDFDPGHLPARSRAVGSAREKRQGISFGLENRGRQDDSLPGY